jgi:dihydropteroate synthase
MAPRSTRSSKKKGSLPRARLVARADGSTILSCGADPASLPCMAPKLEHRNLLIEGVRLFAANILKQGMLSIGGDVAVHRNVINGKVDTSDCLVMGDLRHYRLLVDKLRSQGCVEDLARVIDEQVFGEPKGLTLRLCGKDYSWNARPLLMGILNATPDSFSDGGLWSDPSEAVDHALEMVRQGADLIDIGGESTRPGSPGVDAEEEMRRVIPLVKKLAPKLGVPLSIDTRKARVARAAVEAGAGIINDISALTHDPGMLDVACETGAGVVLMHMRGTPGTMQGDTAYGDIVREVYSFLDERVEACLGRGMDPLSILVDPGIGFGKDLQGNLKLVRAIAQFRSLGVPVVLGHSRKSFLGAILGLPLGERGEGTDAVSAWALLEGVDVLRVHDVERARRIRDTLLAVRDAG